ncbi:LysR family transcriptional regulator [Roseinatronobacter sp. S2]|uniref:LysR family transcriptional regulator n=1 Tax=Roseinatronobacter sp. S2 TaxID=3035471 RepID=UPI00240EECA3|nr:LysR family transcriptional regulator [Roseinatronobacter sp. S2]WFE76672.1 LysR family transcriptional regulator [Roseinatronobacter sp. S2]
MDDNWDDLRLFLAVSRLGGLSAAQQKTGLSPATLGRRVTALERQIGVPLFVRSQTGYALTDAGQDLLAHAEDVERAMLVVSRWREGTQTQRSVRLSAGNWTTDFLVRNIHAIWRTDDPAIEFVTANARIDIGHRAADIGIRNARPTDPHLAGRKIGSVAFALFGTMDQSPDSSIVGLSGDTSTSPSARWMAAQLGHRMRLRGNGVHAVRELVVQGAGLSVLPCFIGDDDPRLCRMGPIITDLSTEQWLVAHHDERHSPPVRRVIERLATLFNEASPLFSGARPQAVHPAAERV